MRRFRPLLFALAAVIAVSPAMDASAKKRRPLPPPVVKPADDAKLRRAISVTSRPASGLPPTALPGAAFLSQGFTAGGFANAGLRSGLPTVSNPAAQCRSSCNMARITCDDDPGAPICSARWAMCIASCDR